MNLTDASSDNSITKRVHLSICRPSIHRFILSPSIHSSVCLTIRHFVYPAVLLSVHPSVRNIVKVVPLVIYRQLLVKMGYER